MIIKSNYLRVNNFSEGLASVCTQRNECGYIDKTGKFIIKPAFVRADDFNDGLAVVKIGIKTDIQGTKMEYKEGVIDKLGRYVVEPRFSTINPFREDLALVNINN